MVEDPTKELTRLISDRKYEEAFTFALQRSDVTIVSWLCSQVRWYQVHKIVINRWYGSAALNLTNTIFFSGWHSGDLFNGSTLESRRFASSAAAANIWRREWHISETPMDHRGCLGHQPYGPIDRNACKTHLWAGIQHYGSPKISPNFKFCRCQLH